MLPLALSLLVSTVGSTAGTERTVFACTTRSGTVSVVRSPSNRLTYRFRRGKELALELSDGAMARRRFSGGGEDQAIFRKGPWAYVVYFRVVRTGFVDTNNPEQSSGVDVMRSGRVASRLACLDRDVTFDHDFMKGVAIAEWIDHSR